MNKPSLIAALLITALIVSGVAFKQNFRNIFDRWTTRENDTNGGNEQKREKKSVDALVVIDPGHGGDEPGTINYGMVEKEINLDISLRLEKLLNDSGVTTLMTRRDDIAVGLKKRAEIANEAGAHLFISVHNNNLPGYPDFGGTETLYAAPDNPNPSKIDSERLAEIVQNELTKQLGTKDLHLKYRPELAVLHRTNMPSVIAEIVYMSNSTERERLSRPEFREKAAKALKDAVLRALEEDGAEKNEEGRWIYKQ